MVKYIKADWFSKMDEIRENAEQEMVEKLKQRFPTAKVSNSFHTKYSGDRILMTINGRRIYVYFLDEAGEDGKPWFCVATDLRKHQGYSGNIEDVLDYIENNMEKVYSSKKVGNNYIKASGRKIKHWQGYGSVNAEKVKDPNHTLHIRVTGDHEWGLYNEYLDQVYSWLVQRFDKRLQNVSEWDWQRYMLKDYDIDSGYDFDTHTDVCDYIFDYDVTDIY